MEDKNLNLTVDGKADENAYLTHANVDFEGRYAIN